MFNDISGIILSGGANRRFGGTTKSLAVVEGQSILSRITEVLRELFPEIIIVTNKPEEYSGYSHYKIVTDQFKGKGPLGGIHAGLKAATGKSAFVIAGDMPFPDKNIILQLTELYISAKCEVLIPQTGGMIEPLHGLYSTSVATSLDNYLSAGRSNAVRDFLDTLNVCYPELRIDSTTEKAFTNINYPADISDSEPMAHAGRRELYILPK